MKGFVPTPDAVVDLMVEKLFAGALPAIGSRILDPGCGRGAFVDGIIRWCARNHVDVPQVVAIESDPAHVLYLQEHFACERSVEIRHSDFLLTSIEKFDYVIGNPPYVSLGALSESEREEYRARYETARGRFDLYLLFFEQALRSLKSGSRMVFITPEKYLFVESASPLRALLLLRRIEQLHFLDEETFPGLVTYPLVTTVVENNVPDPISVIDRTGLQKRISRFATSGSWMSHIRDADQAFDGLRLEDACIRISCGVATGADSAFLVSDTEITPGLREFAFPTLAGRDINSSELPHPKRSLLIPYDRNGRLLPESGLGELGRYLSEEARKEQLLARTCVVSKPWYSFHENPPLRDILRPKILCKDIGEKPHFVIDLEGVIVPRHSMYYLVPSRQEGIEELTEYLNSASAEKWFRDHCQRAAKGYLRLQSHVLKKLPLPSSLDWLTMQLDLVMSGVQ